MKFLTGIAAAAALLACAGGAQAKTYAITDSGQVDGSLVPNKTYTTDTLHESGAGPYTDFFIFKIDNTFAGAFTAAFTQSKFVSSMITSATLSLYSYSGLPAGLGSGTLIDSTGQFSLPGDVPTLDEASLSTGNYYVEAVVNPKKGFGANYSVTTVLGDISSAPEPGTWLLMIAGVGLAGAAFRRSRRYRAEGQLA